MIVDRDELQRLRISSERVRKQLGGARHHLAEDSLVASTRDDRQPLSDGSAKPDAVVEVVMRLNDLCDPLAGHQCIDHVEDRLECGIRTIGLHHGDVVVEFEKRVAVHVPHVVGDLHRRQRGAASAGRALWRLRSAQRSRRAQIIDRCIDDVAIDVELALHDIAKIDRRCEAGRQLNAFLRHVTSECRAKRDVSEIGIRPDVTDPRRKIGCCVHRQRQRVALTNGDVDELQVPLFAKVRQLGGRIERGPHDRDRMGEQLHTPLARRRRPRGLRLRRP